MFSYLGDELNYLNKNVQWSVARHDHFGAFRKETVDDALQPALSGRVALAFYPDHVHPVRRESRRFIQHGSRPVH